MIQRTITRILQAGCALLCVGIFLNLTSPGWQAGTPLGRPTSQIVAQGPDQ